MLQDQTDYTCRIVGWTVADFKVRVCIRWHSYGRQADFAVLQVVVNVNVTHFSKYKKKSDDFHKFTDEYGAVYGFGFYQGPEALVESKK